MLTPEASRFSESSVEIKAAITNIVTTKHSSTRLRTRRISSLGRRLR